MNNLASFSLLDVPAKEYVTGHEARAYMFKGNWEFIWQWLRDTIGTRPFLEMKAHHYMKGLHAQTYLFLAFILPIVYGSWRVIVLMFLLGPFIASFFTSNINEFPAVWCLFSIGLCSTIVLSPIRQYLYVTHWLPYAYLFDEDDNRDGQAS